MRKKLLSITLTLAMVMSLFSAMTLTAHAAEFSGAAGGRGTSDDPYLISTVSELKAFRDAVNGGESFEGTYFKLTQDINLGGSETNQWTPIGVSYVWTPTGSVKRAFSGTFDGGEHKISGLYIHDTSDMHDQGIFGYVDGGTIQNLGADGTIKTGENFVHENGGAVIDGGCEIGGIVGLAYNSSIINCYNNTNISGTMFIGGIAGEFFGGSITNCYNTGDISGELSDAGGIAGATYGANITNCYNTGNISGVWATGGISGTGGILEEDSCIFNNCYNDGIITGRDAHVGGIVGYNRSTITNCHNTGMVVNTGIVTDSGEKDADNAGGIAGLNLGGNVLIENCYNEAAVEGINKVGGVVGFSELESAVENCYNTGNISGEWAIGGVVGASYDDSTTEDCYNTGDVSGRFDIGGIIGVNSLDCTVERCYNIGKVTGTAVGRPKQVKGRIGGVAGKNEKNGLIENCYNIGTVTGDTARGEESEWGRTGGVLGQNYDGSTLRNCYNTGAVSGLIYNGGVAGENCENCEIGNCYYLEGTSSGGINDADYSGIAEVKTKAEFANQNSFTVWNFSNIWTMDEGLNRPTLKSNPETKSAIKPNGGGTIGEKYTYSAASAMGLFAEDYTFEHVAGFKPKGLTFGDNFTQNGIVEGTPQEAGYYPMFIRATDESGKSVLKLIHIDISPAK